MSGFDVGRFVESFPVIAEAEGGLVRLRGMVLDLAASGSLVEGIDSSQWKEVVLSDLVQDFQNGISKRSGSLGSPVVVLRLADIEQGDRIREVDLREIVLTPQEEQKFRVDLDDVLVIRVNGSASLVGRFIRCHIQRRWSYSDHLIRLRLRRDLIDALFLCAVSRGSTFRALVGERTVTTAGQRTINQGGLGSLPFRLPPLAEQKRIVAKVDELMRLIDDLEAKQKRKREVQAQLRSSALNSLTTAGEVEEADVSWKRVAERFDVLVEGVADLTEMRTAILGIALAGHPAGKEHRGRSVSEIEKNNWTQKSLGELAVFVTSGSRNWKNYYAPSGAVFIRSQDIRTDSLDLSSPAFVSVPADAEGIRTRVAKGDLLVTITGANVGKIAYVENELPEAYVSQHVALIRLKDAALAPWLYRWITSPMNGRGLLLGSSYGEKPGLNLAQVRSLVVDLPPLEERSLILNAISVMMRLCDALEAALRRKEAAAAKLAAAAVAELVA